MKKREKKKKSQPIVCFSSVMDEANTQLPAAAIASSNISSLEWQWLMTEDEDKQRAATGIQPCPPSTTSPHRVRPQEDPFPNAKHGLRPHSPLPAAG